MDTQKKEIRSVLSGLQIREAAHGEEQEGRTIEGVAIVFGKESQVLDNWGDTFREVIAPEAVTAEWLATQDVKMNMLHDRSLTIARSNKGEGSLRLSVEADGVHFSFDAPQCDIGDRVLELVRRGDYSGCSFEFFPDVYDVEETPGEAGSAYRVTHKRFRALTALAIGMDPAYTQTEVHARELGTAPMSPAPEAPEETADGREREKIMAAARLRLRDNKFN